MPCIEYEHIEPAESAMLLLCSSNKFSGQNIRPTKN